MLVLVRHGQSEWNALNLFTGWRDVDLSPKGEAEARRAGESLAKRGIKFDYAFTSALRRAQRTGEIILEALGQSDLSVEESEKLNERDYGALTGMNKDDARAKFGEAQVHRWRRSYETRPPEGESLADTAERVLPYYEERVAPLWKPGVDILITAHGNSLRALVMRLEGLSTDEIIRREIATGEPLFYERDEAGQVLRID